MLLEARSVRLACWLRAGRTEFLGFTRSVSPGRIQVLLSAAQASAFRPGARTRFQISLPKEPRAVEGTGVVAGVQLSTQRGRWSRRQCCVDLEIEAIADPGRTQLGQFAAEFRHRILILDDDPRYREVYRQLEPEYAVFFGTDSKDAVRLLGRQEFSVVLASEMIGDTHCLAFFQKLSEVLPGVKASRVVVSEYTVAGQMKTLIKDGGLFAYLRKPFSAEYLKQAVQRATEACVMAQENALLRAQLEGANVRLQRENAYLRQRLVGIQGFEPIVGASEALRHVLTELERVRRTDATVHLSGETGTGKELVARALHAGGPRQGGPFVAQSLATLSETLLESQLFGHVRGAFTGADRDSKGVFHQADRGTLFLDEVADLPASVQASLLRVLQEGEFTPVGASKPVAVDVRVISGTQRDLRKEVAAGRFREDLYFRLAVVVLELPPLRQRSGDVPLLAVHFLDRQCERKGKDIGGFTYEAMQALEAYAWPGNVRELENEVERLVVLTPDGQKVPRELLSAHIRAASEAAPAPRAESGADLAISARLSLDAGLDQLHRALVARALEQAHGNVSRAAERLGIERSRLSKLRGRFSL